MFSAVIQGSVLGALLFLLCVNDVFDVNHNGTQFLFADDNKTVCTFRPEALEFTISNISQGTITQPLGEREDNKILC